MMKKRRILNLINYLVINILLILPGTIIGQSNWIYGIQSLGVHSPAYLVRLDYMTGQYDSVLFLGNQNLSDYGSCIDPFNGRLFLSGLLYEHNGNLHEIDLNTLEINSSYIKYLNEDLELNFVNNSIIYKVDSSIWKLNLTTQQNINLDSIGEYNGHFSSSPRFYNPIDNTYCFELVQDNIDYFFVTDAFSGKTICQTPTSKVLSSLEVDFETGIRYGQSGGTIYEFDPYNGNIVDLISIPDYSSHLCAQQSVYDQVNKKYVIPYYAIGNIPKIAVIDMLNNNIDTTYIQPNLYMILHEIYSMPKTFISLIEDTIYSTYGLNYQWYINGILDPTITAQTFNPIESGDYKTFVDYPLYSSLSDTISYTITVLGNIINDNSINISPNPFNNIIMVNGINITQEKSLIEIYNTSGELIFVNRLNHLNRINLDFLESGLYILTIKNKNKLLLRRKIIKTNK